MCDQHITYYHLNDKEDFLSLLYKKRSEQQAKIKLIPFDAVGKWAFDKQEGNLKHDSGGFFKIQSVKQGSKIQPIINQNEHGILGLITQKKNNTILCLVQMKIEPGNKDIIQISPTVQATESNYKRLHKGKKVKFIEYFTENYDEVTILYKQLQSEQGSMFYKKKNWNIIVELEDDCLIDESPQHYWLSLDLIIELINENNIINMDLRSILGCLKLDLKMLENNVQSDSWYYSYIETEKNKINEINVRKALNTYNQNRQENELCTLTMALDNGWYFLRDEIINLNNKDFIVKFIEVKIDNREITTWSQPIVTSAHNLSNYFLIKKIDNVYYFLVQYCHEIGLNQYAEIGPTFHNVKHDELSQQMYINYLEKAEVIFDANLSEEGGRFYHVENNYKIFELPEDVEVELHENYQWASLFTLKNMLKEPCNINIETRTLISTFDWRLIGYGKY